MASLRDRRIPQSLSQLGSCDDSSSLPNHVTVANSEEQISDSILSVILLVEPGLNGLVSLKYSYFSLLNSTQLKSGYRESPSPCMTANCECVALISI
jgi:hypothetical protein